MEFDELKEILALLKESDVTELQIEKDGSKVRIKRDRHVSPFDWARAGAQAATQQAGGAQGAAAPQQAGAQEGGVEAASSQAGVGSQNLITISAPLVGTFYRSPSPDAAHFVEEGAQVKKGQVVCLIEAMKLMNEIEAEVSGTIVKVMVDNAQPVEYGEPLFLLDPSG